MSKVPVFFNPLYRFWTSAIGYGCFALGAAMFAVVIVLDLDAPEWVLVCAGLLICAMLIDSLIVSVVRLRGQGSVRRRAYDDAAQAWVDRNWAAYMAAVDRLAKDVDIVTQGRRAKAESFLRRDQEREAGIERKFSAGDLWQVHYNPHLRVWMSTAGFVGFGSAVLVLGAAAVLGIGFPLWVAVVSGMGFATWMIDAIVVSAIEIRQRKK